MTTKKYKLIANPAAGRGRSRETVLRVRELLKDRGVEFDLELTKGPRDAAIIARKALKEFDVIVAIGGDGTVNEIMPGMLFSEKPLGIVPAGSGNDFIKSVGIPNNIDKAVAMLLKGKAGSIDVGKINGTYFANGVGIGFDAAVNRASYTINHSKRGFFLYFCALLQTLGKYDAVPLSITINGEIFSQSTFLLTVGNGTTVGGGFKLTPRAKVDDGLLDVTIVKPLALPVLLWHLPKVFLGTIERVKKYAILLRTEKLTVMATGPVPVHVDGEIYGKGETRFEIEVVPKALMVIGKFS
ncbi:MAG TPA: diacylglycerol kinase family protein [Nitrospirota bacterium]|nr:diacylglycerol kinase family protein [Nitrospirota bacterium]